MLPNDLVAGRYRLLRPIGAGAMGTVWAARHELLGRTYALKIASTNKRDARALFLREVRIVGALRHRNVVDIADAGETGDDGLYLAMELLEGESLADRIARAPIAPEEALAITADVCRALAAAHAAGVVHRDVKPENVFLARDASGDVVPKLLDFGVSSIHGAEANTEGKLYGTPAYMSPEQALGEPDVDHRVDLWAVGVMLYEMLAGQRPFDADSYPALLPLIIDRPHPPLPASIPADVVALVDRCLAKRRADRHESADALVDAVVAARAEIAPVTTTEGPMSARGVTTPRHEGKRARIGLAIAGVVVASGFAAGIVWQTREPRVVAAPVVASAAPTMAPTSSAVPIATAIATAVATASSPTNEPRSRTEERPRGPAKTRVTKVDSAGF